MTLKSLKLSLFLGLTFTILPLGLGLLAADANPEPTSIPATKARTYKSNLPLVVTQIPDGDAPRPLGMTGPGSKMINIPAGPLWVVQPMNVVFGFGGGGGFGFAGVQFGGMAGGINLGAGAIGAKPAKPIKKPAGPVNFGAELTGDALKALVADMKKSAVPGLQVAYMTMKDDDVASIVTVPSLQTLLLGPKAIDDSGMLKLKAAKSLRFLSLEGTDVTETGLKALEDVKMLTRLHLGGDKIDNKAIESLKSLKSLTWLRLAHTKVDADGLKALTSLATLTTLELQGPFTDADLDGVTSLTGLKRLRLHQTAITDDGLKKLKKLKELETLSLDAHWNFHGPVMGFGFGGGGVGAVGGAVGNIGGGMFGNIGRPPAMDFGKVQWVVPKQLFEPATGKMVTLAAPKFTSKGLEYLADIKKLTDLQVSHEKLVDADMATLGKLVNLKRLSLFAPEVTDKGLDALKTLTKAESFDLRGTQMTIGVANSLKGLPVKLVRTNLITLDPKYKAKLAEMKKFLPKATIQPLQPPSFGAMAGGF